MKVFKVIVIINIVFWSCSKVKSEKEITYDTFPKEISLKSHLIQTKPVLPMVGGMILLENVLITMDLMADPFFQVFEMTDNGDLKYIDGFVYHGKGPNEEIAIDPYFQALNGNQFIYQTVNNSKIVEYNIDENKLNVVNEIKLPKELSGLSHIFKLGDKICGTDIMSSTNLEFTEFHLSTKKFNEFGSKHPGVGQKIPDIKKNSILGKIMTVRPDGKYFASAYANFPILRIYDNNGILRKDIRLRNNQEFPFALLEGLNKEEMGKVTQNYRKIKSTNNYIYALYVGKTIEELSIDMNSTGLDDFSNEIHVWDWEGNRVAKVLLDRKIFSFVVTPNDDFILASSLNSINNLYKFEITIN